MKIDSPTFIAKWSLILGLMVPVASYSETPGLPQGSGSILSQTELPGHPESVAEKDGIFYTACIGKEMTPTVKDGDGFIATIDKSGQIISPNAFPDVKLDAPKGAVIEGDILYVTDIDRIVGIDIKTGKQVKNIDLSREKMVFLNDLAEENGILYASATDINKLFTVDPASGKYIEFRTKRPLSSPNGLVCDRDILYVAEYATADGKPQGQIKAVNLQTGDVSTIVSQPGQYDGLAKEDGVLYFSDWEANNKPGAVKKVSMTDPGTLQNATSVPANGPADFIIKDAVIWLPSMVDKRILRIAK